MDFNALSAVVMDMDGVLWRGDEPLPGLVPFFDHLRARGLRFALATNNSGKSPADYVQKLSHMGVSGIREDQIVTSGTASINYLRHHYPADAAVHVLGGDGLRQVMSAAGFRLVDEDARLVIVGLDPKLDYPKLKRAALLIRAGADFIATNEDATYPMPDGLAPGAGSLVAALKTATDRQPVVIGKPHRPMFDAVLELLDAPAERTLMIGDRLNTDIAGAAVMGMRTALVLTGVATRADLASSPVQPDAVYADLVEMLVAWS